MYVYLHRTDVAGRMAGSYSVILVAAYTQNATSEQVDPGPGGEGDQIIGGIIISRMDTHIHT